MMISEEQTMIRDMARQFAQDRLVPANGFEAEGGFPDAIVAEMGQLGLLGMTVPTEWGGAGVDMVSYVLALEEIAAGCGALSTMMSVNNSPVAAAVNAYGTNEQKRKFLAPLAQGKVIGAFCLTEPQAGSDASALKTRARRDGDHFVIDGTKQFVTSGRIAGFALVFAVTDPAAGKKGISCFIVPTDTLGYRVAATERKLGQRASDTCQIAFESCRVPAENMLGGEGEGYRIALANLETGRIGIAAQAIGMAKAAFEAARDYAGERQAFGTQIVNHQAVAFRLADMVTQIAVARQMALHAAELKQSGLPCLTEAAMAKVFASEMAEKVCSDAIQIHGGYGYVEGFPVERIYRDVRVCQIYEGTSDVQRLIISRALPTI